MTTDKESRYNERQKPIMLTTIPSIISALALLLSPLSALAASPATTPPSGENWWSQQLLNQQKTNPVGTFSFENVRVPFDPNYDCEEGVTGVGYWEDSLITCGWVRGSVLFDTQQQPESAEECATVTEESPFLMSDEEKLGFKESCEGLVSGASWEDLATSQLYGTAGLVAAGSEFSFLGVSAVPVAFKKVEEHERTVSFTNSGDSPFTVSDFTAAVSQYDYAGRSETHVVVPAGTDVLTEPVEAFEVAPGETKTVSFTTTDPLVSVVRTNDSGEVSGYGNVTRISVSVNGETYWFDETSAIGSAQRNHASGQFEESVSNLFPACSVESGYLSIGFCAAITTSTVRIDSSLIDIVNPPEVPECPAGTHEIGRFVDELGNVHLTCAPDVVGPVDPGTPVDPVDPGTPTTPVDPVDPTIPVVTPPVTTEPPVVVPPTVDTPVTPAAPAVVAAGVLASTGVHPAPIALAGFVALILLIAGAGVKLAAARKQSQ